MRRVLLLVGAILAGVALGWIVAKVSDHYVLQDDPAALVDRPR